jgi:hypothetical protein
VFSRSLAVSALLSLAVTSVALAREVPSTPPIVVALATATPLSTPTPTASPAPTATPDGSGSGAGGAGSGPRHVPTNTPDPVASRPGVSPPTPIPFTLEATVTFNTAKGLPRGCPATLEFLGHIQTSHWPAGSKRVVTYKWVRSDGASTSPASLTFDGLATVAQTQSIPLSWTIAKSYEGYVALEISAPVVGASNKLAFALKCGPPGPTTIAVPTRAPFGFPSPR